MTRLGKHLQHARWRYATVHAAEADFVREQRESLHSMSLSIMASKRGAASLTSSHSFIPMISLLILPFCLPTGHLFSLTPFLFSTLLTSNAFPLCFSGGHSRKVICFKDRQTEPTDCCKLWHEPWLHSSAKVFYHIILLLKHSAFHTPGTANYNKYIHIHKDKADCSGTLMICCQDKHLVVL